MGKQLDLFTEETQPEALKNIITEKMKVPKKLAREITKDTVKKLGIKKA